MSPRIRSALFAVAVALVTLHPGRSSAFMTNGVSWPQTPVPYYVNPTNVDGLATAAIEAAVKAGADTWQTQSGAPAGFSYAGLSSQTTNTLDSINLVMFRNESSGSAIATTYYWMMGSAIVDADIVFWDGGFSFFTGNTGCSNGFYIEDIAAHEFGHVTRPRPLGDSDRHHVSVHWCVQHESPFAGSGRHCRHPLALSAQS